MRKLILIPLVSFLAIPAVFAGRGSTLACAKENYSYMKQAAFLTQFQDVEDQQLRNVLFQGTQLPWRYSYTQLDRICDAGLSDFQQNTECKSQLRIYMSVVTYKLTELCGHWLP